MKSRNVALSVLSLFLTAGTFSAARAVPQETVLFGKDAPKGFRSVDDPHGGRLLEGSLAGAGSAESAFRAGLKRMEGYFDTRPRIVSAVQTRDGKVTVALFQAVLQGTPISGFALTEFDPKSSSRVAIAFDDAQRFPATCKALLARSFRDVPAEKGDSEVSPKPRPVPSLQEHPFADGTGSVRLPADWQAQQLQAGCVVASGPHQEKIAINLPLRALDPNIGFGRQLHQAGGPGLFVPYAADPVQAFVNIIHESARQRGIETHLHLESNQVVKQGVQAKIAGTDVLNNVKVRFHAFLTLSPCDAQGNWLLLVTQTLAPETEYNRSMPTLTAISRSYRYNQGAMTRVTMAWIEANLQESQKIMASRQKAGLQQIQETGQRSINNARAARNAMDQSASGFLHYINDTNVVQFIPNGSHGTTSANFAHELVTHDPEHFREVPISEYRPGD